VTAFDIRHRLMLAGYSPVPVSGKAPPLETWQTKHTTNDDELRLWDRDLPHARSTGVLTRLTPALDIDILSEDAAEAVEALARERFEERGYFLVRVGRAPKRAIIFRTTDPFKKITVNLVAANGGSDQQKLELLADGQQLVAFGIHASTGQPYRWHGGEPGKVAWQDLPDISEAEAQQLIEDAAELLCRDYGYQRSKSRPKKARKGDGTVADENAGEDWAYLTKNIHEGHALHDSLRDLAGKLVKSGMNHGAAINYLRGLMTEAKPQAEWDDRWKSRYADISRLVESAQGPEANPQEATSGKLVQSSSEFVAGFVPPDYLVDGLLVRQFVYSFTGPTGHGKTTVMLRVAAHVANGLPLDGRQVEKSRVLFFAGENPDDIRMRWIKLCEELGSDPHTMDVFFMPGTPPIAVPEIRKRIDAELTGRGRFGLLIVDTSAAYFSGDDENSNTQLGAHARMLRSFVKLPGGPTVIVTCHPIKNFSLDNLLPRGGGAFLNEMDGNLVCFKDEASIAVTWHGKFRGSDFAPLLFNVTTGTSEKLKDSKGRSMWTVTAAPISETDKARLDQISRDRQVELLSLIQKQPSSLSLAEMAEKLGWRHANGNPNKQLAHRTLRQLTDRGLVKKESGEVWLTKAGEAKVKNAEKTLL